MQRLTILGATGSIGQSTLAVVEHHPDRFSIFALSAAHNGDRLLALCRQFRPTVAVLEDATIAARMMADFKALGTELLVGRAALETVASHAQVDTVVLGIVGAAGLPACFAAANAGKKILLANKEPLVMAGEMILTAAKACGARLVPVDSEHNAIFQCLPSEGTIGGVRRLVLTASGGPLRQWPLDALSQVTPVQACAHPNWKMGKKISIDSATMMNKGLEVMEAHWLFGVPQEKIEVVIHPQSIVHSLVDYVDGSMLAHLSQPDMRIPIAHALAYPERMISGASALDLARCGPLTFEEPEAGRFPCLQLAYGAMRHGGAAPIILNAANEVAVAAFLEERIGFLEISRLVDVTLQKMPHSAPRTLPDILAVDHEARTVCRQNMV